jgi:hypothetical protein
MSLDLLKSPPNVDFLRLYRNGVSHFPRDYFYQLYMPFLKNPGSVQWVRSLHEAFFNYLDEWFAAHGLDGSPKAWNAARIGWPPDPVPRDSNGLRAHDTTEGYDRIQYDQSRVL